MEWSSWLRTTAGIRGDGSHYKVTDKLDARNSGTANAGIFSPKGTATFGPWSGTEFYVNAGMGFHSNDARGTTISYDSNGEPVDRVTPLVRAKGAEVGVRTVALPHLQSTISLWTLRLGSELVYNGDLGATEPGPASKRYGIEIANYYSPQPWLIFDGDVSKSHGPFLGVQRSGPVRAGSGRSRHLGRRQHRQFPSHVRQPAPALLRAASARRGQFGALEGHDAAQPRRRVPARRDSSGSTWRSSTWPTRR